MERIKEFTVGASHTINLGSYESLRVEASVTVNAEDLDFNSLRTEVQINLSKLLEDTFRSQAKPGWFANIASKRSK